MRARNEMTQSTPPVEQMVANGAPPLSKGRNGDHKEGECRCIVRLFHVSMLNDIIGNVLFSGSDRDRNIFHFSKIVFRGNFKRR